MRTSSITVSLKEEENKINERTPLIKEKTGEEVPASCDFKIEISIVDRIKDRELPFFYSYEEVVKKRLQIERDEEENRNKIIEEIYGKDSKDKCCCLVM